MPNVAPSYTDTGTNGQSNTGLALRDFLLNGGATAQYDDPSDPRAQANLAIAQQYDPNATMAQAYGHSYIDADWSKLPKIGGTTQINSGGLGMTLAPTAGTNQQAMALHNNGAGGILHALLNPNAVQQDANYGDVTDFGNISNTPIPEKKTALDTIGPMIPMIASAIGTGGLSLGALGSMGQGGAGALSSIFSTLGNGGQFNPLNVAASAAGFIPGMGDIMKYLNMARGAYGAVNQIQHGNTLGGGLTLGNLGNNIFGGSNNGG
jgi:hypothetical protein